MDNNNPVQPIPNMQPNPAVNQPQATPSLPSDKSGSKMVFWLIGGLILIILIVGGIYIFLGKNTKEDAKTPAAATQPVTQKLDDVSETEVEAIGVGDLESEFSSVDQDLKSL